MNARRTTTIAAPLLALCIVSASVGAAQTTPAAASGTQIIRIARTHASRKIVILPVRHTDAKVRRASDQASQSQRVQQELQGALLGVDATAVSPGKVSTSDLPKGADRTRYLLGLGKGVGADEVVYAEIEKGSDQTARVRVWRIDVATEKALLDGVVVERDKQDLDRLRERRMQTQIEAPTSPRPTRTVNYTPGPLRSEQFLSLLGLATRDALAIAHRNAPAP